MSETATGNDGEGQRFLTVEELATLCHVKPRTVYDWIAKRAVPYRKAGRRALFPCDEIEQWMDNRGLKLEQIS
jgi:excisionase family DNA binding protein